MILEKGSDIKVLRNFYENPFDYYSVTEISKSINVSRNWIYKIIKKFEGFDILSKSGKKYKLDFSDTFCKRLKLLFDSEYLNSLPPKIRDNVLRMANKIIFELNPKSIMLVGSVAFQKMRKESDIDFLVIGKRKKVPHLENCNMIVLDKKEFEEKYLKGDDFIISALSFGKVIYDNNVFLRYFENPLPIFSQELIQEKIKYCEKLEERIYVLLKTDEKKAGEELLYLALQAARIILLRNKITPKTKCDIPKQVKTFDKKLAGIITGLLEKSKLSKKRMLEHIRTCMEIVR